MDKKHITIIGGNSGIGLALVQRLLEMEYDVTCIARSPLPDKVKDKVTQIEADILKDDPADIKWPDSTDGLVYCPGSITLKPFRSLDADQFRSDFEINLIGAVQSVKAVLPALKKSDNDPAIVLFGTVATRVGMPFHTSIAAAKGAVQSFAVSLAAELSPNIRVNCIAPSLTDTPLADSLLASDRKREAADQRHPLKRVGKPEDQAEMAAFLLSANSSWITGQTMPVDGGISTLKV